MIASGTRPTARWWRSAKFATTRSWAPSSTRSSSRPDRPHPLFSGFIRAAIAEAGGQPATGVPIDTGSTADENGAAAPTRVREGATAEVD